jgi:Polyketide cyclase / dehydrase and lipid transport
MEGSVTVSMAAPADKIWNLIADVRNTGKFSPETFEAEWLDGATGPALGARFRGHVRRNEMGPVYWTTCRVTACEPGREFGFEVLVGERPVNNWHYRLTPTDGGTDVTESFRLNDNAFTKLYSVLGGQLRTRRNLRDMRKTLERVKAVVESSDFQAS